MSKFSTEEKVRIVLDGMLSGRDYLALSAGRDFTEHLLPLAKDTSGKGKEGLISQRNGKVDPQRAKLTQENQRRKELVANLSVDNLVLKKRLMGGSTTLCVTNIYITPQCVRIKNPLIRM